MFCHSVTVIQIKVVQISRLPMTVQQHQPVVLLLAGFDIFKVIDCAIL